MSCKYQCPGKPFPHSNCGLVPRESVCLAHAMQKVSYIVGLTALRLAFLWDMDKRKWCNGSYIKFRQSFAKETFSYDEYLKS